MPYSFLININLLPKVNEMMDTHKNAVVIANIRQNWQTTVVPTPVGRLIIFDTETTGLGAWNRIWLPSFPPHGPQLSATRAHWRLFWKWIFTERSSCFNHSFSSVRYCISSLRSSNVETTLLWRPYNSVCFTTSFCLCSSTFSRPIFRVINFAWSSYLATTSFWSQDLLSWNSKNHE